MAKLITQELAKTHERREKSVSRLDEIKNDYKNGFPVDIDYLLQCVEESRKWHKMYEDFSNEDTKDRLSKKNYEMQLQNERYKQALEFYADEETYEIKNATDTDEISDPFRLIDLDEGEKATKALKEDENND